MTVRSRYPVVVIGAGQAGLSISAVLAQRGVDHVVLEASRIGERWRSARWDSFCLVTPNWATRLADDSYAGADPDGFMDRDDLVQYFEHYASSRELPIVEGEAVNGVRAGTTSRFDVITSSNVINTDTVVVATGTHQSPKYPAIAHPGESSISNGARRVNELHASEYRNAGQLASGGVLVVGAGQSGCQIAEELSDAGREVWLSTSRVGRLPRRYRGVDSIKWQYRMGFLDRHVSALENSKDRFRPDPHLSGKSGGHTIDLRTLETNGVRLLGRLVSRDAEGFVVAGDLQENLDFADEFATQFMRNVDNLLEEGEQTTSQTQGDISAEQATPRTNIERRDSGPERVDFAADEITTVIWATGFKFDFSWIQFPVFDESGYPEQREWKTTVPGLHFLGLNYVETRGSGILYGVGSDAQELGRVIEDQSASANTSVRT